MTFQSRALAPNVGIGTSVVALGVATPADGRPEVFTLVEDNSRGRRRRRRIAAICLGLAGLGALSCGGPALGQANEAGARHALEVRSQALNDAYGLGEREPAWLRALRIRSEGLNRLYGLG